MNYYQENGQKVKCDKTKLLGSGFEGNAYLTKHKETIKLWHVKSENPFAENLFEEIRALSLPNYYKLISLLYKDKKEIGKSLKAHGYLYHFIPQEEINILSMPTDYTLDNLNALWKANQLLTEHNILTRDLCHPGNIILNQNKITAIDTDYYIRNQTFSKKGLAESNILELGMLFESLYTKCINEYYRSVDSSQKKMALSLCRDLFHLNNQGEVSEVSKKLRKYKCPRDYLFKK